MVSMLKTLPLEELRSYILMEKIYTPAIDNAIMIEESVVMQAC